MKKFMKVLVMAMVAMFAMATEADAQKKWAVQCDYVEGLACVKDANGKWGHINEQGKLVGKMWRSVCYFQDGLAPVETDDEKWGYVDKTGKVVIPNQYYSAGWFSEGLAVVSKSIDYWLKYGYIDKTEKVVIPFKFKKAYPFEHGKARVQDEDGNWRKIDKTGKFID